MTQELILILIFGAFFIGVLLYIWFANTKKHSLDSCKENPFLGSESTNSYYKGVTVYEELHKNPKKAQFKGDHKRHA